jgi:hypothetical protein
MSRFTTYAPVGRLVDAIRVLVIALLLQGSLAGAGYWVAPFQEVQG